jgi:hypothetical protein
VNKEPAWWFGPATPALGRQMKEDHEFQPSLGYTVRSCIKKKKKVNGARMTMAQVENINKAIEITILKRAK